MNNTSSTSSFGFAESIGEAIGRGIARGINAGLASLSGGVAAPAPAAAPAAPAAPRRRPGRPPKAQAAAEVPEDRRCKVEGCPNPTRSKGLCSKHYQAARRQVSAKNK